jgi:hypothetical protein
METALLREYPPRKSATMATSGMCDLLDQAFREFGTSCLWSITRPSTPSTEDVAVIAGYLRRNGNLAAFRLAAKMESQLNAAITNSI